MTNIFFKIKENLKVSYFTKNVPKTVVVVSLCL